MRLLLISPSFFGYETSLAEAFRDRGWAVDLVDERPSNRAWARAAVRVAPSLLHRRIDNYYRAQVQRLSTRRYDALLVVKGEVVPPWFVEEFRGHNPDATLAYYTYDAVENSAQGMRIIEQFSHRFTFDRNDASTQPGFQYKPLFYSREYTVGTSTRDLGISFVGTLHGERYRFAKAATADIPENERELFFFSQAPWYFWLRKVTSHDIRPVARTEVSFVPLDRSAVVTLAQRSRTVLDLQRAGQTGLTMRTFETLATGAGLITANEAIRDEPFYDESRILVVSRDPDAIDPTVVADFVANVANDRAPDGFEQYSLDSWVEGFDHLFRKALP